MKIQIIREASEIPEWVSADAKTEITGQLASEWNVGSALAIDYDESGETSVYWDGGESEDNFFHRDWGWVKGAIQRAYEAGKRDGEARR